LDDLFGDDDLFAAIIPEMAEDLARETELGPALTRLSADEWETIIYAVAPPESMQQWAQEVTRAFRRWIRTGRGRFLDDALVPFGEIRDNLTNDPDATVLRTLIQAQPPCTSGREPLDGPSDLIPQCRPPSSELDAFTKKVASLWRKQPQDVWRQLAPGDMARYPKDISLADLIEDQSEDSWDVRVRWRAGRFGIGVAQWMFAICIAGQCIIALVLIAVLAARNWREAFRWVGTPLALAGMLTFGLAILLLITTEFGGIYVAGEDIPRGVQEVIEDAARAFVSDLWPALAWQGGVLVLIGLGIWVLAFFAPSGRGLAPVPAGVEPPAPPTIAIAEPTQTEEIEQQEIPELGPEPTEASEVEEVSEPGPDSGGALEAAARKDRSDGGESGSEPADATRANLAPSATPEATDDRGLEEKPEVADSENAADAELKREQLGQSHDAESTKGIIDEGTTTDPIEP
jgi:hypothetical protein